MNNSKVELWNERTRSTVPTKILRIDLSKLKEVKFFIDPNYRSMYSEDIYGVCTYSNIPPNALEVIE